MSAAAICAAASHAGAQSRLDEETSKLRAVEQEINQSRSRAQSLEREHAALEAELSDVSGRLVELAGSIQSREARISESEERIEKLSAEEAVLRTRLTDRRGVLAELLAGLQRLERNPPPPLAVEPENAARAVRGALLFGAIVPDLKGQAASLSRELAELQAVRERVLTARSELDTHVSKLEPVRRELEQLLIRKRTLLTATSAELMAEQKKATQLARQAGDIRDLLASLAKERRKAEARALAEAEALRLAEKQAAEEAERLAAEQAAKAAEAARLAKSEAERLRLVEQEEQRRQAALEASERAEAEARAEAELKRLAGAARKPKAKPVLFASSVGKLAYPAQGEVVRNFNDKDGFGGKTEGLHIATAKRAQITVPVDGDVEFAGEFRSFGKLIIVNTGDGYHLLFAGLDKIAVSAGQKLAAGEPIGTMGTHTARGTLIGDRVDDPRPILYVEVRKGSAAIDSSRWWAAQGQNAALRRKNGGNES